MGLGCKYLLIGKTPAICENNMCKIYQHIRHIKHQFENMSKTTKKSERALANRRRPGLAWLTTCLQVIIDCDPSTHTSQSNTCCNKYKYTTYNVYNCDLITILLYSPIKCTVEIQREKNCRDSFCLSTDKLEQQ